MMCTWKVTAPSGSRLNLTFNYFGLESGTCSTKDYLEVRDGSSSTSTRKGTYCGSYAPSMTSSGRYLWIRFRSDSSVSKKGFEARYTILTPPCKYPHFSVATYSVCCGTPETSNGSVPFAVQPCLELPSNYIYMYAPFKRQQKVSLYNTAVCSIS